MPKEEGSDRLGLRRVMIINTLSNYSRTIIGIAITIFLTRALFLGLSREEYGFWALLWSIFGYSLLLDFGFGVSIQKYTSQTVVSKDWDKFNRLVSTVFYNYVLLSGIIIIASLIICFFLHNLFSFSPANESYFKTVVLMFGIGTAITFPYGFFSEILRGMQKMHLRNIIQIIFMVLNFVGMLIMLHFKLNLVGMSVVAISTNLLSNLVMALLSYRLLPDMHIRLRFYDKTLLREVIGFSVYAYLITFTNLVIFRSSQVVISVLATVSLVAVYQISSRLAETFRGFSAQFLDNLGPVAATLHAAGNKDKMSEIMLQSNRLMGIISTLMLIPLLVYIKPILQIWLNLNDLSGSICAIILLLSMYILLFFRSSSVYILLMANEEKLLARIALLECVLNLGLSILLILTFQRISDFFGWHIPNASIIGVAVGTFIPNVVLAFAFNIPQACRYSGISVAEYFRVTVWRTLVIGIITVGFAYLIYALHYPGRLITVFIYSCFVAILYSILTYFFGLEKWEQNQIRSFVINRLHPKS